MRWITDLAYWRGWRWLSHWSGNRAFHAGYVDGYTGRVPRTSEMYYTEGYRKGERVRLANTPDKGIS